jgi:hypothetical protein
MKLITILSCRGERLYILTNNVGIHEKTLWFSSDKSRAAQKVTRSTIILLLRLHSLWWERVYRAVAMQRQEGTRLHRLTRRIYRLRIWDVFICYDMTTKIHGDWLRHSKLEEGLDTQTAWSPNQTRTLRIRHSVHCCISGYLTANLTKVKIKLSWGLID